MLNPTHPIIAYSTLQDRRAISHLLIDYFMRSLIAFLSNLILYITYLYVALASMYLYVYAPPTPPIMYSMRRPPSRSIGSRDSLDFFSCLLLRL